MIVTLAKRPDWFTWRDPLLEWCQANVDLPGLIPGSGGGRIIVDFHISHFPCMPEEVQMEVGRLRPYSAPSHDLGLLRSYQAADLNFLGDLRSALLVYQMRMGKTPLACHLHDPGTGILVIVGPLAAREVWRDWVDRTFHHGLICLEGRKNVEAQPGYPAYFCHFDVLGAHSDFFQRQRIGTLVLDECFPAGTLIETEFGRVPIEKLVEGFGRPRVLAKIPDGSLVWAKIAAGFKKVNRSGLVCVYHERGTFLCTPTHRIWTEEDGFVQARHLTKRHTFTVVRDLQCTISAKDVERALLLQGLRLGGVVRASEEKVCTPHLPDLQSRLCCEVSRWMHGSVLQRGLSDGGGGNSRLSGEVGCGGLPCTRDRSGVRGLRDALPCTFGLRQEQAATFLQSTLRCSYQPIFCRSRVCQEACVRGDAQATRYEESSGLIAHAFVQSNTRSTCDRKDSCSSKGPYFSIKGRETRANCSTKDAVRGFGRLADGTHNSYGFGKGALSFTASFLSSGHRQSREEASYRGRREQPQYPEVAFFGCEENSGVGRSRVVGVAFQEQSGSGGSSTGGSIDSFVYDIEVENAHNYFANGVLVSNCHLLQGRKTQRLSAMSAISPRAGKILGLSGTPMWNRVRSLYPILHTLMPGAWGTNFVFCQRYAGPEMGAHGWIFEGASNTEELNARLAQVMVRRTWQEVMPDLPPTTRVIEPVELTGAQFVAVEAAAARIALAKCTTTVAGYQATLRRKLGEVKIKPALETAKQAAADGHKVVLWFWHNENADKAAALLPAEHTYRLRSADNANLRDFNVQAFRAHAGPCFLVANMGVGGVALDLSCSDYGIFVEFDWTPANMDQTAMRTFHIDRPHCLVFLYADCPIEASVVEALDVKNGFAAALGLSEEEVARKVLG